MLNKLFKDKKKRYRNLALFILPFILLIGLFGYLSMSSIKSISNSGGNNAYSDSITEYDYHLRSNPTKLQKDLFNELNDAIRSDDDVAIAQSVVENYVADFYTWTNKNGQYDIGGMYYVYSPQKGNIYDQARNSFYKYVNTYINEYGQDKILEVVSVDSKGSVIDERYEIDGKTYDAFYVECTWEYADHKDFTSDEYRTKEYFTVIKNDDGRFEIVDAYGD